MSNSELDVDWIHPWICLIGSGFSVNIVDKLD